MNDMLRELYQEMILDHGRHPRNFCQIEHATDEKSGFNPLCGDKITLYLNIKEGRVVDASFQGEGCAISVASASLLTESIKGKTLSEAETLFSQFHEMVTKNNQEHKEVLGKISVLAGVCEFPARVKCATLAWHSLEAILKHQDGPVTTE